ncbi:MAG: hypothetical protein SNJ58_12455 [Aggregatilineales bacterium]
MLPEDIVLIGVINRRRDLAIAQEQGWYRLPVTRAPRWIAVEYVAFYLSRAFGEQNGAVRYYARCKGHELWRRCDLLPDEADHPRADQLYYRLALAPLCLKQPPILNPTRRPLAFLYTTWERFLAATCLADLYGEFG